MVLLTSSTPAKLPQVPRKLNREQPRCHDKSVLAHRHQADRWAAGVLGRLLQGVAIDDEGLADAGKIQEVVQAGGGPDRSLLDATMGPSGRFTGVGLTDLRSITGG